MDVPKKLQLAFHCIRKEFVNDSRIKTMEVYSAKTDIKTVQVGPGQEKVKIPYSNECVYGDKYIGYMRSKLP